MRMVQDQLTACTNIYVEEALVQQFVDLVRFVTEAEAAAKASVSMIMPLCLRSCAHANRLPATRV